MIEVKSQIVLTRKQSSGSVNQTVDPFEFLMKLMTVYKSLSYFTEGNIYCSAYTSITSPR